MFTHQPAFCAAAAVCGPQRLFRRLCALLGAVALASVLACSAKPRTATLLLSSRIGGVTAPCGCTSRPLGGLDRVAYQVENERRLRHAAYVVVGDTFFQDAVPSDAMRGHSASTGRTIAQVLARLSPLAVATGPRDHGRAANALASLAPEVRQRLGLVPPAAAVAAPVLRDMVRIGGNRVGLLRPTLQATPGAPLAQAIEAAAAGSRRDGAQGVILLWPYEAAQARQTLAELDQVDAVLCGAEDAPHAPEPLGKATLLDGGARGEHLGRLELQPKGGGRWQFYDGGAALVAQIENQRRRLLTEAERLPEGPAREARRSRAEGLAARAKEAKVPRPATAHFTWSLIDIDEHLPKAGWASDLLARYNDDLCATARSDTAARTCLAAATPAETYVGSATCRACHNEAWEVYEKTAHARAWATLTTAHKACDLSCVGCHVVGWEEPGGFCHLEDAAAWANVGCESCHGPGRGHVEAPQSPEAWGSRFVARPGEQTCRGCHNAEHSDQFNIEGYLPRVLGPGHGVALGD